MGSIVEKPLITVGGKTMLERVVNALRGAAEVEEVYVATSPNTHQTEKLAQSLGLKTIRTGGRGYVADAQEALKSLHPKVVLVISADLPLISCALVDHVVRRYEECGKPSLKVVRPVIEEFEKACPSSFATVRSVYLEPAGINVIDSRLIDQSVIDEAELLVDSKWIAANINTPADLEKISSNRSTHHLDMTTDKIGGRKPSRAM
jgi:adenosylcobinamide-phosphate guanylyltransferase